MSTLLRFASAILRSASLVPCTLLRSVKKRCPALLRRAGRYFCGVGYRPPPCCQPHCMIITNNLLALGHCSVGVACRSFLSLCRFPPPSLLPLPRSARAPPPKGNLICLFGVLARSGATPKATFGYAGLHSTSGLSGGKLAALALPPNNPFVTLQPSSAKPRFLRAPSFARSKSGVWHCCAEPSVLCAVSATPSAGRYGNFKL